MNISSPDSASCCVLVVLLLLSAKWKGSTRSNIYHKMDKMYRHRWATFIIERLKNCLHNPILITCTPLSSLHKQSQQLERPLNSSTKSLCNQGISPREKRGWSSERRLIWEQFSCHVLYHLGDHMHPLSISEDVNKKVNTGPMKETTPRVQAQRIQSTTAEYMICVASTWRFLIEEALRQTVIIFALSRHSLWGQTHYEVQAERQRKVFLLSSTRDLCTSRLSSLSEWARSVWWSEMSLAFSGYYMYQTVRPHDRSFSLIRDAKRYYYWGQHSCHDCTKPRASCRRLQRGRRHTPRPFAQM